MAGSGDVSKLYSAHFKAFVATAMHHYLIDRAIKIIARKKSLAEGGNFEDAHQPPLGDDGAESIERAMQVARSVKATLELEVDDPRAARIIKLKNGGLTNEEIVEAAGVELSAVRRDWRAARLPRLSSGIETGLIVRAATVPQIFFSSMNRFRPAVRVY